MIILSPHLDDAALSAYSHLTACLGVVNVFTGEPTKPGIVSTWDRVCGHTDSAEVARIRRAEDEAALASIGVRALYLGIPDAGIRHAMGDPFAVDVGVLADEIQEAVADVHERVAAPVVLAPLAGGPRPNPDHVLVRDAALILHRLGLVSLALYADQPYVYKGRSWPSWVDASDGESAAAWWSRFPRAVPDMVALDHRRTVRVLGEEERAGKLALMQMYESQFENLNRRLRTKNLLRDPDLYGVEVFWSLDPPPRTIGDVP